MCYIYLSIPHVHHPSIRVWLWGMLCSRYDTVQHGWMSHMATPVPATYIHAWMDVPHGNARPWAPYKASQRSDSTLPPSHRKKQWRPQQHQQQRSTASNSSGPRYSLSTSASFSGSTPVSSESSWGIKRERKRKRKRKRRWWAWCWQCCAQSWTSWLHWKPSSGHISRCPRTRKATDRCGIPLSTTSIPSSTSIRED